MLVAEKLAFKQHADKLVMICLEDGGHFKLPSSNCGVYELGLDVECNYFDVKTMKCTYVLGDDKK